MTTYIYCTFPDLPASKIAEEQFAKAKEVFELTCQAIKANLKQAEVEFVTARDAARKKAKFEFYMTEPTINEYGKYYHIHRRALNPVEGDTEFYKAIAYTSFKIVNNVFICTGSGYRLKETGTILSDQDIINLDNGIVPDIFKS